MGRGDAKRKPLARKKNVLSQLSLQSARNVTAAPMIRRLARRECDPTPESSVSAETTSPVAASPDAASAAVRCEHWLVSQHVYPTRHVFSASGSAHTCSCRHPAGSGANARQAGPVSGSHARVAQSSSWSRRCRIRRRRLGPDWATPRTNRTDSRSVSTQPSWVVRPQNRACLDTDDIHRRTRRERPRRTSAARTGTSPWMPKRGSTRVKPP